MPSGYVYAGGRYKYFSGGVYRIDGLTTGNHVVRFDPLGTDYLREWYDNIAVEADAVAVAVTLGQGTGGINAEFDVAGSITGTVVGAPIIATPTTTTTTDPGQIGAPIILEPTTPGQTGETTIPVGAVSVVARSSAGYVVSSTQTAADGTYRLRGLVERVVHR